ncbi:hypothetical protein EV652_111102 [Kribbella steppae]|uniref:Uncharacterized protein n=1 Tax=Kribbella steppae TaxID=2512223 RepID=A0A4R2H5V3_9ACTN|nr:hypothetical protein [Kribbella steppae]TCO21195.1 hypothetical protein EV652_111102 [Kribbella steppae]
MAAADRLIAPESAVYREFVRLYRIARTLRSTPVDRWNGELYATDTAVWGSVSPLTGAVRLSAQLVLPHLTGKTSHHHPVEQAEALATVLHESTHAGMALKAPTEPNAVDSKHSLGLTEGVAEVRAIEDFQAFTWRAGYQDVVLPGPQYEGAFAATDRLLDQASGIFTSREDLTDELVAGPAATHFDRLAGGVVRNRLWDVVPHHPDHQRAVRAALIRPMLHDVWPQLPDQPTSIGERVALEIRMGLDAKVDEVRRYYRGGGWRPFEGEGFGQVAGRGRLEAGSAEADVAGGLRFLDAQAPADGAVALRPSLGLGARRTGPPSTPEPGRTRE